MRLGTSRKKFSRHLGLFLLAQHAHVYHGLVLAGVRTKRQIPAVVFSKKNQGFRQLRLAVSVEKIKGERETGERYRQIGLTCE